MNLSDQCVSLDLAKRLKELGVKRPSLFCWTTDYDLEFLPSEIRNENVCIAAYTVGELLDLLPYYIITQEPEPFNSYRLYMTGSVIVKNPECIDPIRIHIVNYLSDTYESPNFFSKYLTENIWDENPANTLGKMLIFLYEQGLIKNDN